jgi:hypothetical protein
LAGGVGECREMNLLSVSEGPNICNEERGKMWKL